MHIFSCVTIQSRVAKGAGSTLREGKFLLNIRQMSYQLIIHELSLQYYHPKTNIFKLKNKKIPTLIEATIQTFF